MAARGAAAERMTAIEAAGFGLIGLAQGLAALASVTSEAAAVVAMVPAVWPRVLSSGEVPAFLSAFAPSPAAAAAASPEDTERAGPALIGLETVMSLVQRTAGSAVDADAPLMEAGLDSLGAVELRNQLQQAPWHQHAVCMCNHDLHAVWSIHSASLARHVRCTYAVRSAHIIRASPCGRRSAPPCSCPAH